MDLLRTVRRVYPTTPFVLFTGQGSEKVASEALRAGASDYITKQTGLIQFKRLVHSLRGHVRAQHDRREREEVERRYHHLVEHVNAGIALARGDRFIYANPKLRELTGYSEEELTSTPFSEFLSQRSRTMVMEKYRLRQKGENPPRPTSCGQSARTARRYAWR